MHWALILYTWQRFQNHIQAKFWLKIDENEKLEHFWKNGVGMHGVEWVWNAKSGVGGVVIKETCQAIIVENFEKSFCCVQHT